MHDKALLSSMSGVLVSALCAPESAAETLVFSDVSARVVVAMRVPEPALRAWLPAGWRIRPFAEGPNQGANLLLGFVDRLLHRDPAGKVIGSGVDRFLGLIVPATKPGGEKPVNLVLRIYHNAEMVPGAYHNSRAASIERRYSAQAENTDPAHGSESWRVSDGTSGAITLRFSYRGAKPTPTKQDLDFYSAVEPSFYRIYRFEQSADVVLSRSAGIDRTQDLELSVTIEELAPLFDGSQELVSVVVVPWNSRQVFLP